jgi:hypothetical protein
VQPGRREVGEVGEGIVPGVGHHRQVRIVCRASAGPGGADRGVPGRQLVDHVRELGDVGFVAGVGVPGQRDAAVPGDHQAQADQAKIGALLLRLAPLADRRLVVGGVDEGGEVGHVQRH